MSNSTCLQVSLTISFMFLKWFTNGPSTASKGFQHDFENSLEIGGAEVPNIKIWEPLSLSHNFLCFPQMVYQWPCHRFLQLSKRF